MFDKRHDHVLRDIDKLIEEVEQSNERTGNTSLPKFGESDFIKSTYISSRNREYPEYLLIKDGFTLLVMGYDDDKDLKFKLASYIYEPREIESWCYVSDDL